MIKKVISAVLAVTLVSSVFITAYAADTEKAKKYFKPSDLSGMFDFMTGKSDGEASEKLDVNEDGAVNILDTISMKQYIYEDRSYYKHVLSSSDYDRDIKDSNKLNRMAETVAEIINGLLRSDSGIPEEKGRSVSFDDGSETAEEVNRIIHDKYGYRDLKWIADYSFFGQTKVICSVNNEKTGAYPLGIPDDIIIPFDKVDSSFFQYMSSSDADWHNYYCTAAELNESAKQLYHLLYVIVRNSINKGKYSFSGEQFFDSEFSDEISVLFNGLISRNTYGKYIDKWSLRVVDGEVRSLIVSDITENVTGAYPEAVPQNLEITFSDSLHDYAEGTKKWKNDFSDCISSRTEIASLPDFTEISEEEAIIKAYNFYWFLEMYYPDGVSEIRDGVYDRNDIKTELLGIDNEKAIFYLEPLFNHEHMFLTFSEGELASVRYKNECGIDITVTSDMYNEAMAEEPERVTTKNIASRSAFTNITGVNDGAEKVKVPEPDYHLYYSTDEKDGGNTVIRLRTDDEIKKKSEWVVTISDDAVSK